MIQVCPIERRALLGGLAALAGTSASASTTERYVFDQTQGTLEFTARHLGILSSTGRFDDFSAVLLIDPDRPLTTTVAVIVRTASAALAYPGAVELLRSPEFFDVAEFPEARFDGAATGQGSLDRFSLAGNLTIRGITRPFSMQARLLGRRRDEARGKDIANFSASGEMKRSEFGMTAESSAISDRIGLSVRVSLIV
ncbi:YceI family protein [Roseomonas sp. CAU 1739]|uniref:YceI family protein n=1 Tax=Roseomonas sp. CAU 1739 TaxID=3140364 RepID=UPI00325B1EFF